MSKVNSVQEACTKCFAFHKLKFEIFQTTWENETKTHHNARFIDEKAQIKSLMFFFVSFLSSELQDLIKFIYFEKATKFCEIFNLLLSYVAQVKSKVKISKSIVAFSEYMNFILICEPQSIWSMLLVMSWIYNNECLYY